MRIPTMKLGPLTSRKSPAENGAGLPYGMFSLKISRRKKLFRFGPALALYPEAVDFGL